MAESVEHEVLEHRQGFFKGGVDHPMSDADLQKKFFANCAYGGLSGDEAAALAARASAVFDQAEVTFG